MTSLTFNKIGAVMIALVLITSISATQQTHTNTTPNNFTHQTSLIKPAFAVTGTVFTGTLYFTTFSGGPNVNKVDFTYDNSVPSFSLAAPTNIASTAGADGIIFGPDGKLLVAGQGNPFIYRVDQTIMPATVTPIRTAIGDNFHLALDPSGSEVWVGGIPGPLEKVPMPLGPGTIAGLVGDDGAITGIAFDQTGQAFYTSSGAGGFGNFGKIDLSVSPAVTTRIQSGLPAAHGIVFDPFTNTLILFGSNHISQINPTSPTSLVSDYTNDGLTFDQGAVDGKGHIFGATNNGLMIFIDYSVSGKVGDISNFVSSQFLANSLDDVAPLVGPGAPKNQLPVDDSQTISTNANTPIAITLVGNDADGDSLTYSIVTSPSHGTLGSLNPSTGMVSYTPNAGFTGTDTFTFKTNDGIGDGNTATVTINVLNTPPVDNNQAISTNEDTPVPITLVGTDGDGDTLTYSIVSPPTQGTLGPLDPSTGMVTYTPNTFFTGTDTFTFKTNDGTFDGNTATVTITVNAVNTPGKVTGGGGQTDKGANFGFNVQSTDGVTIKGQLEYQDKTVDINLHSTSMTSLNVLPDKTAAAFSGTGTINGSPVTFQVIVKDNGEPGTSDLFSITISNGYSSSGTLTKGNIDIH